MPVPTVEQAGAILWRRKNGGVEFLIVTTNGGGWSIPKGGIDEGETSSEAAAREALEEAGALGRADEKTFATYEYSKFGGRYRVSVHLVNVTRVLDDWDEKHERDRKWVGAGEIAGAVSYPNIAEMLKKAADSVGRMT
jgi:8-oxo-dGTP pyrophosphatase MutT (NUDIX family)